MFNKLTRLSPAFEGYTLFDTGGDLGNFTTMQIVNQGDSHTPGAVPIHFLYESEMRAGIEDPGYYLRVWGWDIRFNINLSSVPERARYGKISLSAPASYAAAGFGEDDPDLIGRTQYRNSSGSYIDILPAYGMGPAEGKYPGDCSFVTTDTVNDYIENQGGIIQLRIVNTGNSSVNWYGANQVTDDIRVQKIEIVGA